MSSQDARSLEEGERKEKFHPNGSNDAHVLNDLHGGHVDPYIADPEHMNEAGVKRIEAISSQLGAKGRALLFFGVFVFAWAYNLDSSVRYTLQGYATASFGQHSLLATLGVITGVVGAATQPIAAKLSNVFGRVELLLVAVFFYAIGTAIEAGSKNVQTYAGGVVIYQVGQTMFYIMLPIIIADMSSLKSRLALSFIPPSPYLIIGWISGYIVAALSPNLDGTGIQWQWGIGMWAIITPFASILLVSILFYAQSRAKKAGLILKPEGYQPIGWKFWQHTDAIKARLSTKWTLYSGLFWQLDVIGALILTGAIAMFLIPFTLAGGVSSNWSQARILAPLVIGICLFPVFVFWESRVAVPFVPFKLLSDRGIWAGLGVGFLLNTAWYCQGAYVYPMLIVAFDQSIISATRISGLYTFCSTLTGIILGLVIIKARRLKPFIVFGSIMYLIAFGLLIRFRSGQHTSAVSGIIGAEILLGIGAGCFSYPTIASIQARTRHQNVAVVTALYLAIFSLGGAMGNVISGAVWTNRMPVALSERIANQTLAAAVYADPYTNAALYPWGSPEREGMVGAYASVQRILAIIGICLCVPLVVFAFTLRNPVLGNLQSHEDAEKFEDTTGLSLWQKLWR